MQRAVALIYPDQCALCTELVDAHGGLCVSCWRDTQFANGLTCAQCARPLPGTSDGGPELCDDCLSAPPIWSRGFAAVYYSGAGRRFVLALKYGDRTDLASTAAAWMARAASEELTPETVILPISAHWRRLLRRRYNPAVELAKALGRQVDLPVIHDGLIRHRATKTQEGLGVTDRFLNLQGAFKVNPKRMDELSGKRLIIVDDTMTSGATLTAATQATLGAGAASVSVLVLARTLKNT